MIEGAWRHRIHDHDTRDCSPFTEWLVLLLEHEIGLFLIRGFSWEIPRPRLYDLTKFHQNPITARLVFQVLMRVMGRKVAPSGQLCGPLAKSEIPQLQLIIWLNFLLIVVHLPSNMVWSASLINATKIYFLCYSKNTLSAVSTSKSRIRICKNVILIDSGKWGPLKKMPEWSHYVTKSKTSESS